MDKWHDDIDELLSWQQSYTEACDSGVFPAIELEKPKKVILKEKPSTQELYWEYLYNSISGNELLKEEEKSPSLDPPNPVQPDSLGKDQDHPKPQWVDNDGYKEFQDMKQKLYDLECKLGSKDSKDVKWNEPITHAPENQDVIDQIETLKKRMDDFSDKFGLDGEWGSDTQGFDKLPPYDGKEKSAAPSYDKRK